MKALVTGGAGFIGASLATRLVDIGWEVIVIDNLSSGFVEDVPTDAQFIWGDVSAEETLRQVPNVGQVDVVFHLAGQVGQENSFARPLYDLNSSAVATLRLLEWCKSHSVERFVFASSVNVYGRNPSEIPITEKSIVDPPSPYAIGKIASEYFCNLYAQFGMKTSCLRFFNIYGPGQRIGNLTQGMVRIFLSYVIQGRPLLIRGSRDRYRDFVYISDVIDAMLLCADPSFRGGIYNIATGEKTFVGELVDKIIEHCGYDPKTYPIEFGDETRQDQFGTLGSSAKIASELGWHPKIGLDQGLKAMIDWAKNPHKGGKR